MTFITNPDRAAYDFDRGRVNFYAEENGERVLCAVSEEAIQDLTNTPTMNPVELVELYRGNAQIFAHIAEEKFRAGQVDPDGYFVVSSADVMR